MKVHNANLIISKNITYYLTEYMTMVLIALGLVGITAGSHSIGLPLYKINPMHWAVYLVVLSKRPSFSSIALLAFTLPLTSSIFTGHPMLFKSLIMGVELTIYGIIFISAIKYFNIVPVTAFVISQITGRFVYYGLKYILIKFELIDSSFVSTSIFLQIVVFGALGIALFLIDKNYIVSERKY